jgi:plastocyanin
MEPRPVVIWLVPLIPNSVTVQPGHFRLIQKDKMFRPHLLVIPVGSTVTFPNEDPFFHNVFSLFNGKRFDLGLYEAGTSRDVNFTHEGVSYIFCNIHPEMSAVIMALATPYYAVSSDEKRVTVHGVPPGTYRMNIWTEGADPGQLQALSRTVDVGPTQDTLGTITIPDEPIPGSHKNKFGQDYSDPKSLVY